MQKDIHYIQEDPWRILRIMADFVDAFEVLAPVGKAVTIFGSARTKPNQEYYKAAQNIASLLSKEGYAIITGGGPGIMEAANRGAKEGKNGKSIGLNIALPFEQKPNPYVDHSILFHYFFARKVCLAKYSVGFVFMPGGFGTLDEMSELITLVQTHRIPLVPLIFFGSKFWKGFLDWVKETLVSEECIAPEDVEFFYVVDNPKEVVKIVDNYLRRLGDLPVPNKWMG